jgi:hypothetical protein
MCAICGRYVLSETEFFKDVELHMMGWYMEDNKYEAYQMIKNPKEKHKFFAKHARSVI